MSKVARRTYRERLVKEILFVVFTMALVLGISFFVGGTVVSQTDGAITVDEEYYQVLEQKYVQEIRGFLNEQGYKNSGVNLTMMTDEEGNRNYSVEVYHKGICKLTEEARQELFDEVEALAFAVIGCRFEVSLLI